MLLHRPPFRGARRWLPVVVLAIAIVAASAWVLPQAIRDPLFETLIWSLLVVVAFAGWGSLVRFGVARTERVDLGLRVVWGASAACMVGGLLAACALMTRGAAFALVEAGVLLSLASLVVERTAVSVRLRSVARGIRRQPPFAIASAILAGVVLIHYVAGIAETHTNPYDDDIAYLSFVKKMLDTGTVLEPFSLRRLSAMGGQTFFLELVSLRAAPSQANTFDRSICLLIIVMLVLGHRDRGKRVPWVVSVTAIAFFLLLPSVAINTASYYSGVAFFLGLFRTVVWLGQRERRAWQSALPVALVGAAACTLRQNYLMASAGILGVMYAFRFFGSREPWRQRLTEPLVAALFSAALLVPWFIQSWQSNQTFFYPVMLGTANQATQFQSNSSTLVREIHLQIWTLLEGMPLKTLAFFVLAAALVHERDPRKPLASYVVGAFIGYIALIHGLTQGEPVNIGRYAFGFFGALCLAAVLGASTARIEPGGIRRGHVAIGLVLFGSLAGLVAAHADLPKFYTRSAHNIEELSNSGPRTPYIDPPEVALYQRLQASVPAGARIAVMLDEPYHLDFKRNPIWNLDMPGYASLPPGLPYFKGSQRVEEYFRDIGVRYIGYVRNGYSRYHYRREYWLQMIVDEQEVWRIHAPYVIDFVDNLRDIDARHHRVFDERGLAVIDLEAPR